MSTQRDENSSNAQRIGRLAERLALAGFLLYALAAPHSIAGAWIGISIAVLAWIIRALSTRRTGFRRTALDLPLLCFIGWTVLSSFFSAEPRESIAKLVNVSTFLMFYLTQSFLTRRRAVLLAAVLIVSGAAGVLWGAGELIIGRGVVVTALSADSPLRAATPLGVGDAVWRVNKRRVASVEEIDEALRQTPAGESASLSVVSRGEHVEWPGVVVTEETRRAPSPSGITGGGPTHSFRASGWTRHYETFAEMIQIIAQLALGFALAWLLRRDDELKNAGAKDKERARRLRVVLSGIAFIVLAAGIALTAMRTTLVAFAVGALVVAWRAAARGRQRVWVFVVVAFILGFGAVAVWRTRASGALSLNDASASLRLQVARVAASRIQLHPVFGHGMDAVHKHWNEWGFPGSDMLHAHSTPLQLAFDRGIPALLFWLWLMYAFWRQTARAERMWRDSDNAGAHGLALGLTGALAGFLASSLVNYNFGDAEVALLVWWMMGVAVVLNEEKAD
jgi:hypothetical protein